MILRLVFLIDWLFVLGFINRDDTPVGIYLCATVLGVLYLLEVLT